MLKTPLDALHRELGARMVPFAGYEMPVQYPAGIMAEHSHTREAAGLFDVSHMGQVKISGPDAALALESLLPVDLLGLAENAQVYSLLTNDKGGVRDDLIVTRWGDDCFFLVVNAACKDADIAYLQQRLVNLEVEVLADRALLALQGPGAREVIAGLIPEAASLVFMNGCHATLDGQDVYVTCSGYTGEDGFELSIPAAAADAVARRLLAHPGVEAIGLGARDSLRLEAGLCLYGHELSEDISPVQACVMWSVSKARRVDGERAGGFPGADNIFEQAATGVARRRVGLQVAGKRPVREGQLVLDAAGEEVGVITSACVGVTLGAPIAMAMVDADLREPGTELSVDVRGKLLPVTVSKTPFVPQRYYRG
ncbi:MAG: glycine cleavage system aminomethyltransferase GcvT [Halieaceae bacterium]